MHGEKLVARPVKGIYGFCAMPLQLRLVGWDGARTGMKPNWSVPSGILRGAAAFMPPGKKMAPPEGRAKGRNPDRNRRAGTGPTEGGSLENPLPLGEPTKHKTAHNTTLLL